MKTALPIASAPRISPLYKLSKPSKPKPKPAYATITTKPKPNPRPIPPQLNPTTPLTPWRKLKLKLKRKRKPSKGNEPLLQDDVSWALLPVLDPVLMMSVLHLHARVSGHLIQMMMIPMMKNRESMR